MQNLNNTLGGVLNNQTIEDQIKAICDRTLSFMNTIKLCKIVEILGDKKYKVQNLVSRITADSSQAAYDEFYEIYDGQEIGGNGGFVIERKVGDIVVVGFFDRESTRQLETGSAGVLKSRAVCPPSSGVILGAVYYGAPEVNITINNNIVLNGDTEINGNTQINGTAAVSGNLSTEANLTIPAPINFISGGATLTFLDASATLHHVVNGLITD